MVEKKQNGDRLMLVLHVSDLEQEISEIEKKIQEMESKGEHLSSPQAEAYKNLILKLEKLKKQ